MAKKPQTHGVMTTPGVLFALFLGLTIPVMGSAPHALAQEQDVPTASSESAAADESPASNPEDAVTDAAADQEAVLEDYEASEQISEDLSVSFPVDI